MYILHSVLYCMYSHIDCIYVITCTVCIVRMFIYWLFLTLQLQKASDSVEGGDATMSTNVDSAVWMSKGCQEFFSSLNFSITLNSPQLVSIAVLKPSKDQEQLLDCAINSLHAVFGECVVDLCAINSLHAVFGECVVDSCAINSLHAVFGECVVDSCAINSLHAVFSECVVDSCVPSAMCVLA